MTTTLKEALEIVYQDIVAVNEKADTNATNIESNTSNIETLQQEVANLKASASGVLYNESEVSGVGYELSVSENALPYGTIDIVGGMSYKSENLIVEQKQIYLRAGNEKWISWSITGLVVGQQYTIITFNPSVSNERWQVTNYSYASFTQTNPYTFTATSTGLAFRVGANNLANDIDFESKVMLVSGSTAPTTYQPYFEGIRNTPITSVISKDSNDNTLATGEIPQEIQALNGYGWGISQSVCNYIDFENKKFVQKVIRIPLKDLSWSESAPAQHNFRGNLDSYASIIDIPNSSVAATAITRKYTAKDWSSISLSDNLYFAIGIRSPQNTLVISIVDNDYSTNESFIDSIQNDYLYIKLATPIETDISEYITDNTMQFGASGTITLENEYEQEVPYQYTILEKVSE